VGSAAKEVTHFFSAVKTSFPRSIVGKIPFAFLAGTVFTKEAKGREVIKSKKTS
jgi:hypothetical protein